MGITKSCINVTDWTAIAQNAIGESAEIDVSAVYESIIHIQAAIDNVTAHTGTKFTVQISSAAAGNEDWQDHVTFVDLIGTAATDLIQDATLTAGSTAMALTAHGYTVEGIWLFIEDGTLVNSELVFEKSQTTNEVVVLDGTTNDHIVGVALFNVAFTKNIILPSSAYRARVLVDNTYDADGATLDYKVRLTKVTAL